MLTNHVLPVVVFAGLALALSDHGTPPPTRPGSTKHHVLVGNFGTDYNVTLMLDGTQDVGKGFLYTLEVDAEAKSLALARTSLATAAHPWLSINANAVYASGWSDPVNRTRTFSAYTIEPDFSVSWLNTITSCGTKPIANDFIPEAGAYGVFYGVDFVDPCGEIWSVNENGSFGTKIQAIEFEPNSTLHGFATTPDLKYMYIMNLGGNNVHGYELHLANGTLTTLAEYAPSELGAGPRHAAIAPSGKYLYLIDEEGLRVDQYTIDDASGALRFTDTSLAVTPFGLTPANSTLYWGDEIVVSSDGATLYASTRSKVVGFSGYISGWALRADGALANADAAALFTAPTPGAGGTSNILSVSPWADASKDMIILTDQDKDFVALYELQGRALVLLDTVSITGTNCCSGSVWLD